MAVAPHPALGGSIMTKGREVVICRRHLFLVSCNVNGRLLLRSLTRLSSSSLCEENEKWSEGTRSVAAEDKIGNFFRRARLAYLSYLSAKIAVSTQKLFATPGTMSKNNPARDWLSRRRTRSGAYANWMLMLMGSQ